MGKSIKKPKDTNVFDLLSVKKLLDYFAKTTPKPTLKPLDPRK